MCLRVHTRSAPLWRPIWTGRRTRSCTNCLSTSERSPSLTTSLDSTTNTGRGGCKQQFAVYTNFFFFCNSLCAIFLLPNIKALQCSEEGHTPLFATYCLFKLPVQVPVKETAPLSEDHPGHPGCTRHRDCHMQTVSFKFFISNGATDPRLDPPATKHFKAQDWVGLPTLSVSVSNLSPSSLFSLFSFGIILYLERYQEKWLAVIVVSRRGGCVGFRSRVYLFIKACRALGYCCSLTKVCVQRSSQRRCIVCSFHNWTSIKQ